MSNAMWGETLENGSTNQNPTTGNKNVDILFL